MNIQTSVDTAAAIDQLKALGYSETDKIYYRAIGSSTRKIEGIGFSIPANLKSLNSSHGIYFVVNGLGHSDKDVEVGRALFYEHDDLPKSIQIDLWQSLGLPEPTCQVDTGGKSVHSYWVFDQPIAVDTWKVIQADLLEYANADRTIKNPSRVMRLAGYAHQKTGVMSTIVRDSGKRYSFDELRSLIAVQAPKAVPQQPRASQPIEWPVGDIPLEKCIAKSSRDLIRGGSGEGGRNCSGNRLAMDLIGTEKYLRSVGQRFEGDARSLFDDYCQRCSPALPGTEIESIWRSAEKSSNGPSLSEDKIQTCVDAFYKKGKSKGDRDSYSGMVAPHRVATAAPIDESDDRGYQEELEHFQSDRDRLNLLSAARFSNETEEFWLGSGKTSEVCSGIRSNIKNGWVATAVSIGQTLAALTPREVQIVPPDRLTSVQPCLAWNLIEALKSGGKSVVFLSMKPFLDALQLLEWSRSKDVASIRQELVELEHDENISAQDKPVTNKSLQGIEPSIYLGDFTIAYLKVAMAAAAYWPRLSKEAHTRIPMRSCGTLIFCREAVQFFENLGAFNQKNSAAQSFLAGAWAGEVEVTGRKTGGELTRPGDVALGMVLACQPNQFSQIIANESSRNAVDTGFGIRFDVTTLENSDRKDLKFEPRDMNAEDAVAIDLFPTLRQFQSFVGLIDRIICDETAAALYEHELFPWLASEDFSGWLDGYASKAVANTLRLAWSFQCIEIFDALASGDRPSPRISGSSMARAIEKTKLSLASLRFHVANLENERTITAKLKESEQQGSLVKSKYGAILTDPQLAYDFVSRHRSQGIKSFRSLLQKINSKSKKELKEVGLDAAAVLRPVWDELESLTVNPIATIVATAVDPIDEVYEYKYQGD